jgi:hypothetical protein
LYKYGKIFGIVEDSRNVDEGLKNVDIYEEFDEYIKIKNI